MVEYIKKLTMRKCCIDEDGQTDEPIIKKLNEVIDFINSIDVAPVRHGRWVKMDTTGLLAVEPVWNCSSCGYPAGVSVAGSKYCPNCGAKMDLEDNHDSD